MNAYAVNTRGDDYTENDDELLQNFIKNILGMSRFLYLLLLL